MPFEPIRIYFSDVRSSAGVRQAIARVFTDWTTGVIQAVLQASPCGLPFVVQHAMDCKRGGFVWIRMHNEIRDLEAAMLSEVCKDVSTDLQPLTGEHYQHRTAITTDDARVNVKARGFCRKGQTAFFLCPCYPCQCPIQCRNLSTDQILKKAEQEKKTRL